MTRTPLRILSVLAFASGLLGVITVAPAQTEGTASSGGAAGRLELLEQDVSDLFGRVFGGRDSTPGARVEVAQMSASDLVVRLDRIENHLRQLTGAVEQLQYRTQQLEQQARRFPEDGSSGRALPPRTQAPAQLSPPAAVPQGPSGRRSDVFDPAQDPDAPGAPRTLGSLPSGTGVITADPDDDFGDVGIGAPGGRQAGAPLDLSTLSRQASNDPTLAMPSGPPPTIAPAPSMSGPLPAPPPRNPNATGAQMVMAPSATPRDEYDLAYGYVLRKDYALAEEHFRAFLKKYPADRLAADANFWLGESLFQRQRYRDAAETFLTISTRYDAAAKAPDALLRLGQSLAALGEKDAACATLGEVTRKYPRASPTVKQNVDREQKRVRC